MRGAASGSAPLLLLLVGREGAAALAPNIAPGAAHVVHPVPPQALEPLLAPPALGAGHVSQASLGPTVELYQHTGFLLRAGVL